MEEDSNMQGRWKQFKIGCAKKLKGRGVLKKRLIYHAPLTRYSEFSIISTSLINTGAVEQGGYLPTQFLENKIEIL